MPKTTRQRCIYEDEEGKCRRIGYGDPPLCEDHEDAEVEVYDEIVDAILSHPAGNKIVDKVNSLLDSATSFIENLSKNKPLGEVPKVRTRPIPKQNPRDVLHFGPNEVLTKEKIDSRKKELALLAHPDRGGSNEAMAQILTAADMLKKELTVKG